MSVIFVVLPLAVLFSGLAVAAFLWSTRSGQLDDLETPPLRILGDAAPVPLQTSRTSARTSASSARSSTCSASTRVKMPTTLP